ncbi:PaaI family thioesterase [Corynebacterium gerontici]|uniref:Esterase n=1 Tax=Corynebacterium gerontici TaxID=2079234 RepID=A0A3G6J030_9CORY|nr:PaaI family thioesterase [Corynebacterium gerontici]AZA11391.1 Putative esterase [Corynebacterium gerontici]
MSNQSDMFEQLASLGPEGLSIAELERFNEDAEGFTKTLGMRFTKVTPDLVAAELHVSGAHLQPAGIVNGGVYSSLAESAGSILGLTRAGGNLVVGVNCNADFIASVSAGVIDLEARFVHAGRSSQLIEIVMHHRGKLVSRATLRTMVLQKPAEAPKKDKFAE